MVNDRKDRRDFETGNGANNDRLFRKISEMVNDTDLTELDDLILPNNPGDEHITAAVEDDGVNPKDFTQQSWQSLAKVVQSTVDLVHADTIIADLLIGAGIVCFFFKLCLRSTFFVVTSLSLDLRGSSASQGQVRL